MSGRDDFFFLLFPFQHDGQPDKRTRQAEGRNDQPLEEPASSAAATGQEPGKDARSSLRVHILVQRRKTALSDACEKQPHRTPGLPRETRSTTTSTSPPAFA
jgi:hypothetical protein